MAVALRGAAGAVRLTNGRNLDYSQSYYETFAGINDIALVGGEVPELRRPAGSPSSSGAGPC
jgi:hypothetical protein